MRDSRAAASASSVGSRHWIEFDRLVKPRANRASHLPSIAVVMAGQAVKVAASIWAIVRAMTSNPGEAVRRSAPIIAVDADITVRQVAGVDRRASGAEADADADFELLPFHVGAGRRLVIGSGALALLGHEVRAEGDRQPVAVGGLAGLADGHHHPAPIGILAGDRGLDQRRIGDRPCDTVGTAVVDRALD